MKTIILAAVIGLGLSSASTAGSLNEPVLMPTVVVADADNWTGMYVGGAFNGVDNAVTEGYSVGVFGGYRYDLGAVVIGAEAGYTWGFGTADGTVVEANIGYDAGAFLPYVSAGYGWDDTNVEGAVYGLGLDMALTRKSVVGVKVSYKDYGVNDTTFGVRYSFNF